jgi:hypothetical protein
MPIIYAPKLSTNPYNVLNGALPLEVRVAALENAVTQLQKQLASLQTLVNMVKQAQTYGFQNGGGVASFEILSSPGMSNVVIPFFNG